MESAQLTKLQQEALGIVKLFWFMSETFYEALRNIEGCEDLQDLKTTVDINQHIMAMADNFGIPKENRYINISPNISDLKKSSLDILKHSRKLSGEGTAHVIFIYARGNGATQEGKQLFLLNSEEAKSAFFHLEYKLRSMAADELSLARIFAVYDCCRIPLKNLPGLVSNKGGGNVDGGDTIEENENLPIKYFHIQSCGPDGIEEAEGCFSERLYDCCRKYSERNPDVDYMHWPTDFAKMRWSPGEINMEAGVEYLMPFGHHMKPQKENKTKSLRSKDVLAILGREDFPSELLNA